MRDPVALPILETSQAGEARRIAMNLATRLGFNDTERAKVGIVVTEIANNLLRYATQGELILHSRVKNDIAGIEILALDKGPGISDITECLRDGYSTGGTPGNGLGAISRLSTFFDIYSLCPGGTVLLSLMWPNSIEVEKANSNLSIGVICLPKIGEEIAGDNWAVEEYPGGILVLVADGLGHGPLAAQASLEAVRIFRENKDKTPTQIIEVAHAALRSTRGAALAIAQIDFSQKTVRFAGIGNISGCVISPAPIAGLNRTSFSMVSHNGTVGHEVRKIQEFSYPWPERGMLVMHSDGLATQWRLDKYANLATKHPSLIAGILYRDFNRGRDDVTVLVAK